jgi:hypothetical protein
MNFRGHNRTFERVNHTIGQSAPIRASEQRAIRVLSADLLTNVH